MRPLNAKEIAKGSKCCLDFNKDGKQIAINMEGTQQQNKFEFDAVFDTNSTQKEVYDTSARPIIDSVLDGFNFQSNIFTSILQQHDPYVDRNTLLIVKQICLLSFKKIS